MDTFCKDLIALFSDFSVHLGPLGSVILFCHNLPKYIIYTVSPNNNSFYTRSNIFCILLSFTVFLKFKLLLLINIILNRFHSINNFCRLISCLIC